MPALEETTRRVLQILERDARVPAAEIAARLGLEEHQVADIIRRCEEKCVIRRYKTLIDWEKAGEEAVLAFIDVRVSPAREVGFDDVASRIYRYPEVLAVYLVSGGYDLQVVVKGPSLQAVAFFVAEKLATIEGVNSTTTHFLLRRYKEDGEVLVEQEEDRRLAVSP
jgi:DNA-binding Lrp family transcriptional regulator